MSGEARGVREGGEGQKGESYRISREFGNAVHSKDKIDKGVEIGREEGDTVKFLDLGGRVRG